MLIDAGVLEHNQEGVVAEVEAAEGAHLVEVFDVGGDINSDAYFGSLSKYVGNVGGVDISPYIGATYIVDLDEVRPLGGLHLRYDAFSIMFQYSGVDEHLSFSYDLGNHTVSFILFNLELPGVAYTFRF